MFSEPISLQTLTKIVKGKFINNESNETISGVSTDSRNITSSDLFIPLKGENFNGHKFIKTAFENSAKAVLVEKNEDYEVLENKIYIEVQNTLKAYQDIATYYRRKLDTFILGITGSSGKTSTKEISNAFLSQFFNTCKSEANFNNEIGVPKTLLTLKPEHQIGIVEMGMRGLGQIKELSEIAEPNAGIITGTGTAHIELLGSKENIAKAKWELGEYLEKNNGYVIFPAYNKFLTKLSKDFNSEKILTINLVKDKDSIFYMNKHWIEDGKQFFSFTDTETNEVFIASLSVLGKHQISNALLSLTLAKILKIRIPDYIDLSFENLEGRSQEIYINSAKIINDAYNANPESMKAAIDTFMEIETEIPKILVVSEMKELGEFSQEAHRKLGKYCSGLDIKKLVVVGKNAEEVKKGFEENSKDKDKLVFCETNKDAADYLNQFTNCEQEHHILLKASRGAKLEEIINNLS